MSGNLQSVTQAVRILLLLTQRGSLGVSELAKELSLSTSTAHRLLSTLVSSGVVDRQPNGRAYRLVEGVAVAPTSVQLDQVLQLAPPVMTWLRDVSGETAHLAVLSGNSIMYVAAVESHQMMRVTSRIGMGAPAHLSAAGKILLAHSPAGEGHPIFSNPKMNQPTEWSISEGAQLRREVAWAKQDGYARNISESELGLYALAVPIMGSTGHALCSLTVSGPVNRINPLRGRDLSPQEKVLLEQLLAGAKRIESQLS